MAYQQQQQQMAFLMAQVAEFRSFIGPSFREIRLPDGLMRYEFTMSVGGGLPDFPVQIIIPARFPYERPTFQFKVPLQHKFVEKSMNIFEHPSFTSPGAKNQSLLEIVSMIYEAFATDPPKVLGMAAGAAVPAAIRPPAGPAPEGKLQRPEEEKKGLKDQLAKPISIDSALAQVLEGMSLDELKLLADNKDCAEELYYSLGPVKEYERTMMAYVDKVADKATANIQSQKSAIEMSIQGKKLTEEYNKAYNAYSKTFAKSERLVQKMTMGNVKKSLVEYAGRLEADIKAAKKKFEQTKQTDEFVNTFMELQKASLKAGFYLDKLDKNNFQYASLG